MLWVIAFQSQSSLFFFSKSPTVRQRHSKAILANSLLSGPEIDLVVYHEQLGKLETSMEAKEEIFGALSGFVRIKNRNYAKENVHCDD
jgi:hypothetical protein